MKTESKQWFEVLEAARTISKGGRETFTASSLAQAAGLQDTFPQKIVGGPNDGKMGKGSTAQQIAAAWLGKFRKWGYCEVVEKVMTGAPRPTFSWKMTPAGMTVEVREGVATKLKRLIEVSRTLEKHRGKAAEAVAWKDFLKVLNDVDEAKG